MALVTLLMGVAAFNSFNYAVGVSFYAFTFGLGSAAFSAVALHAIGKGLASFKYALISSISNIAPVYMTTIDGWLHDKYGIRAMLLGEAMLGLVFIVIFLFALQRFNTKNQAIPIVKLTEPQA